MYFFLNSEMMYLNRNDFPVPAPPVKKTLRPPIATSAAWTWSAVRSSFRRRGPGRELDLGLLAARREEALEGASPVAGLGDALPRLAWSERRASGAAAVLRADAHDVLAVLFALRRADAGDAAEGRDGRGLGVDDGVDRLVVKHAEGRLAVGDALAVGDELVAQRHRFFGCGVPLEVPFERLAACASAGSDFWH